MTTPDPREDTLLNQMAPYARAGHPDAIDIVMREAYAFVGAIVREKGWFLKGAERKDLVQEGMRGAVEALRAWNGIGMFSGFLALCVERQLQQALRQGNRKKHLLHLEATSLDKPIDTRWNSPDRTLLDYLPSTGTLGADPGEVVTTLDSGTEVERLQTELFKGLSDLERQSVIRCLLHRQTYEQAAAALREEGRDVDAKAIDNALQRARRRLMARAAEMAQDGRFSPVVREMLEAAARAPRRKGRRGRNEVMYAGDLAKGA